MAKKLVCVKTGNWSYCSDERYAKLVKKFGGVAELEAKYVSRAGKKLEETGGKVPDLFKNKIECTITGQWCYISDARLKKLAKKFGSEKAVREQYVSRVAKRLLADGKNKTEIRAMAKGGTLPLPTSPKGHKTPKAPKAPKAPKTPKAPKATPAKKATKPGVGDLVKNTPPVAQPDATVVTPAPAPAATAATETVPA